MDDEDLQDTIDRLQRAGFVVIHRDTLAKQKVGRGEALRTHALRAQIADLTEALRQIEAVCDAGIRELVAAESAAQGCATWHERRGEHVVDGEVWKETMQRAFAYDTIVGFTREPGATCLAGEDIIGPLLGLGKGEEKP